jgi:hypothetical protein
MEVAEAGNRAKGNRAKWRCKKSPLKKRKDKEGQNEKCPHARQ